ncbi:hypothetical protein JCM9492_13780 [Aquifex pyrophilus]
MYRKTMFISVISPKLSVIVSKNRPVMNASIRLFSFKIREDRSMNTNDSDGVKKRLPNIGVNKEA